MSSDSGFANLQERWRGGDQAAAADIFRRFADQLVRLAASRLARALRQKVDAEHLVQFAFKSFVRADAQTPFDLRDWDSLWALLATITLHKCGYQVRHFRTEKRDVGKEVRAPSHGDDSGANWVALAREPTPAEAAMLSETVERLLDQLDDKGRQVVELSLKGGTPTDIAGRVGLTERSVYRQFERFKARLRAACQDEAP